MATEKFFVFNESGTLKRLKGRIVRFLDNEDPDNTDKTNIRASISVPASAEGLTPVNNLSDVSSVSTSRDNLGVPSDDEMAQSAGTKLVGPALYFDGVDDYVEVADDVKLSFTDGTDDLPFSVSAWVKMGDATDFPITSKSGSSDEWIFYTSSGDGLRLWMRDASSNTTYLETNAALTSYEGQWIHVAATYGGSGPNSGTAFAANMDNATLYINGASVASTASNNASYAGMSDTTQPVYIGRQGSVYAKGHIKDVKIFNRELTAAEVVDAMNGDLGFADEWAGANGGIHNADFTSDSTDSYTANAGSISATATVGSDSDNIQFTCGAGSGNHRLQRNITALTAGKRYRLAIGHYIPSGQSNIDQIQVTFYDGSTLQTIGYLTTTDAWTVTFIEFVATKAHTTLFLYGSDGGTSSFTDAGEDDTFAINHSVITEIGTLADFRAESFDSDTGKIYDVSSNAFVGTNNGATLTGRAYPVYETGTWTPGVDFGGASVGVTYGAQEGYYTRIGNVVTVHGLVTLTAKGSSTGTATITGLPFTAETFGNDYQSVAIGYADAFASLAGPITGLVKSGNTYVALYDWGATGVSSIDDTNFNNTSTIRFSATYQIQ